MAIAWAPVAQARDSFSLKSQDKQLHMAAAYGLALTSTLLMEKYGMRRAPAVLIASVGTMLIGTGKELLIDDHYSSGDQIGNAIGTTASAIVVFTFQL